MATSMKVQGPTEAPTRFEQAERFRVEAVGSKGEIVSQLRTDDPDKAMGAFVTLVDADKLKDRGAGSHVAITDEKSFTAIVDQVKDALEKKSKAKKAA